MPLRHWHLVGETERLVTQRSRITSDAYLCSREQQSAKKEKMKRCRLGRSQGTGRGSISEAKIKHKNPKAMVYGHKIAEKLVRLKQ